jgi:hypothetical protein
MEPGRDEDKSASLSAVVAVRLWIVVRGAMRCARQ